MRRLHRLSITEVYARISLGLRLSRACNNKSDWLIRGRWLPGMQLNVQLSPLRLAEGLSPSKQLTSTKWSKVHILSIITKNCLSWICGKRRKTILFHGWCNASYTCYQYVARLGLQLAILGSAVRLTVDCTISLSTALESPAFKNVVYFWGH